MFWPYMHEKSIRYQSVTKWYRCGKCEAMNKNVESLWCSGVETVEYLGIRYGDNVAVWETVMWMQSLKKFEANCEIVHF